MRNRLILAVAVFAIMALTATDSFATQLFYESFASATEVQSNGGTIYGNVTFPTVGGLTGAQIQTNGYISYPTSGRFNYGKGTITFWFCPLWNGTDYLGSYSPNFFEIVWASTGQSLNLGVAASGSGSQGSNFLWLKAYYSSSSYYSYGSYEPYSLMKITANTWHKISIYWDFTISGTNQSYIALRVDDMWTDITMVNQVTPQTPSGGELMYIGNTSGTNYPLNGIIQNLYIYDDIELPSTPPTVAWTYNPCNPSSTGPVKTNMTYDTQIVNPFDTNATNSLCPILSSSICPGQNVLFFRRAAFEPTYENYVPPASDPNNQSYITSALTYSIPENEIETLFFGVYSRVNLTNVSVSISNFTGAGTILASACNLWAIKNWFQSCRDNGTVCRAMPYYLPGLFLQNDQINGSGGAGSLDSNTALSTTVIPTLPVQSYVTTAIAQYTSRMFALRVPRITTPGLYYATVTLTATGGISASAMIFLRVMPFSLVDPGLMRMNTLGFKTWDISMGIDPWVSFETDLADMRAMGISWLWLTCTTDGTDNGTNYYGSMTYAQVVAKKCQLAQQYGFTGVIIDTASSNNNTTSKDWQIAPAISAMQAYGFTPYIYGWDECGNTLADLTGQLSQALVVNAAGGQIITTGTRAVITGFRDPTNAVWTATDPRTGQPFPSNAYTTFNNGNVLAGIMYPIDETYVWSVLGGASRDNTIIEGMYWQTRDYANNRYFTGMFNYLTGFNGLCIYGRYDPGYGTMYNDSTNIASTRDRPYGWSYPAVDASNNYFIVSSHRGEIFREGIKDQKYLNTWKYYYNKVVGQYPTQAATSQTNINDILAKYIQSFYGYSNPGQNVSQNQYMLDRFAVITEINNLSALVKRSGASVKCGQY